MDINITWKGSSWRVEWAGSRISLGNSDTDTHPLEGAAGTLAELWCSGPHRLLRTTLPHPLGRLSFPAHVWRLWMPGEEVVVGEHLRLSLSGGPSGSTDGTSVLARGLLGDLLPVPGTSASVVVLSGRDVGRRLFLGRSGAVLGRGRGSGLTLTDETLSRAHLGFRRKEDGWWVEDLGGPNGLYVEGRRFRTCALQDGAVLDLGRVWLRYEEPRQPSIPGRAPGPAPQSAAPAEVPPVLEEMGESREAARWLRALVGLGGAAALIGAGWI